MKNKKVVPLIVNGELYNGKDNNKINTVKKDEKVPQPGSPFTNMIFTIIGILLIVYGVNSVINKKDVKEDTNSNSNSNIEQTKKINSFSSIEDYTKFLELTYNEFNSIFSIDDIQKMATGLEIKDMSNNAKIALATLNINNNDPQVEIKESDLNVSIRNLFGNISYNREKFEFNNLKYVYNNETDRYYLLSKNYSVNNYNTITFVETEENIVRVYTAYTRLDNKKSYTLNNQPLKIVITKDNISDNKNILKYFEYSFIKNNDLYNLESIKIK